MSLSDNFKKITKNSQYRHSKVLDTFWWSIVHRGSPLFVVEPEPFFRSTSSCLELQNDIKTSRKKHCPSNKSLRILFKNLDFDILPLLQHIFDRKSHYLSFKQYDIRNQLTKLGIFIWFSLIFRLLFFSKNSPALSLRIGSKNELHRNLVSPI